MNGDRYNTDGHDHEWQNKLAQDMNTVLSYVNDRPDVNARARDALRRIIDRMAESEEIIVRE